MKSLSYLLSFVLVGVFLVGCDSNDPDEDDIELPSYQVFDDSLYTVTSTGLRYYDFVEGDTTMAPAGVGDRVLVHYSGWLENGLMFDSSVFFRGTPLPFDLGVGQVIDGWDEGVQGMYPGQQRQLVIPPTLAYGQVARPNIPPNSTLIFEVQFIQVLSSQ